jgi:assimilatory nitrate reductase catalytic subunit
LPGDAKPDWWIISQVAKRMGFQQGFNFESSHQIFLEHAALSAAQNTGARAFDIGGLASLSASEYDSLHPIQWPIPKVGHTGTARLFEDGRFYHRDSKAKFVPTAPRAPQQRLDDEYPLVLNTGRVRDQWHSMTRTGKSPRLTSHAPEPYVDLHPQDALLAGTREGELVRVSTSYGSLVTRLRMSGEMPRGMIFVPIHWNSAFASDARVGALVNPIVDPISGEPELKHTPARVTPFIVSWHGFVLTREVLPTPDVTWWTLTQGAKFYRYEMAGRRVHGNWSVWARRLLNAKEPQADWLEYSDPYAGIYRGALLVDDQIAACVFISPRADLPSRTWLAQLFSKDRIDDMDRAGLLVGQAADPRADTGPIVCSCFGIGRKTICEAIAKHGLRTPQAVGQRMRAGTNCGSCVSEIKTLIAEMEVGA